MSVFDTYLSGLVGGLVGAYVGQPMDIVKVRLQIAPATYNNSIKVCASQIYKTEGVKSFWRGITAPLAGMLAINGIIFGVEGHMMKHMPKVDTRAEHIKQHFVCGCVAGTAQVPVCTEWFFERMSVK